MMIQTAATNQTDHGLSQTSTLASVLPMAATIVVLASTFAGYLLSMSIS
ncbi:MAG: hypothetical protein KF883_09975 [Thermomicrobiales bacterium]|nr:hypothetical protein [Thermomicrobiales bacterium]